MAPHSDNRYTYLIGKRHLGSLRHLDDSLELAQRVELVEDTLGRTNRSKHEFGRTRLDVMADPGGAVVERAQHREFVGGNVGAPAQEIRRGTLLRAFEAFVDEVGQ